MPSASSGFFRVLIWLILLVTILLAVLAMRSVPDAEPAAEVTPAPTEEPLHEKPAVQTPVTPTPEPTPTPAPVRAVVLPETEDAGEEYIDRFVLLGDSTTYGFAAYGVLPYQQVWTPSTGTMNLSAQSYVQIMYYTDTGAMGLSIADAAEMKKPEYLLITLGLNGIAYMDEDEFKAEYIDLITRIREVSPGTKIICNSIYPVIDTQTPDTLHNEHILVANEWIQDIAEETGTRYLNTHEVMTDETGNLIESYGNGDGIHLGWDGFDAVLMYIRTHAYDP